MSYQSLRRFITKRNWCKPSKTTVRMEDTPPGKVAEATILAINRPGSWLARVNEWTRQRRHGFSGGQADHLCRQRLRQHMPWACRRGIEDHVVLVADVPDGPVDTVLTDVETPQPLHGSRHQEAYPPYSC